MKLAAVGDLHVRAGEEARIETLLGPAREEAHAIALLGDLTHHGRIEEAEALGRGLERLGLPVLAVLGNHDHDSGLADAVASVLRDDGVLVLERAHAVVSGIGFAGAKGFGGGFGDRIVRAFGEDALKSFVAESVAEATALRGALQALPEGPRVALLHYAPVRDTVLGEPPEIHAFLGTSRLADALDEGRATLALHGHAHLGAHRGATAGGVPVWNVGLPVLEREKKERAYALFDVDAGGEGRGGGVRVGARADARVGLQG